MTMFLSYLSGSIVLTALSLDEQISMCFGTYTIDIYKLTTMMLKSTSKWTFMIQVITSPRVFIQNIASKVAIIIINPWFHTNVCL